MSWNVYDQDGKWLGIVQEPDSESALARAKEIWLSALIVSPRTNGVDHKGAA